MKVTEIQNVVEGELGEVAGNSRGEMCARCLCLQLSLEHIPQRLAFGLENFGLALGWGQFLGAGIRLGQGSLYFCGKWRHFKVRMNFEAKSCERMEMPGPLT